MAALNETQEASAIGMNANEGSQLTALQNSAMKSAFTDFESLSFNFDRDSGKFAETDLNARLAEICEE